MHHCNNISQSCFISFATRMARLLLKLKSSCCLVSNVQLVKRLLPRNEQQIQHYHALLWQQLMTCFITKAPPINSIDSKYLTKKLKRSRTFLIDYSGFISCIGLLTARGRTYTCVHTYQLLGQKHTPGS